MGEIPSAPISSGYPPGDRVELVVGEVRGGEVSLFAVLVRMEMHGLLQVEGKAPMVVGFKGHLIDWCGGCV